MTGTLYGIGLGPGDPELMTLKAARLLGACSVIAYPALPGTASIARSIGAAHIPGGRREIVLEIPMKTDRTPAQSAYDRGASDIAAALENGDDVALLCEGDPLFYGSFMYLHARLSDRFRTVVVPGVSSIMAGAALLQMPLAARNETLAVLPAPLPDETLRPRMEQADSFAILKLGRHLPRVRALLDDLGLTGMASYVERATTTGEKACPLAKAPPNAPYFSMILVSKGGDPWLRTP